MATQVQPPLVEKEITMLFLNAFQKLYYDRLLPSVTRSFIDMIVVGNLVDHAIKNNKIEVGESRVKSPREAISRRRRKVKSKPYFKETDPTNLEFLSRIRLTPTTNPTIHPRTTNHPLHRHTIHPTTSPIIQTTLILSCFLNLSKVSCWHVPHSTH